MSRYKPMSSIEELRTKWNENREGYKRRETGGGFEIFLFVYL
jgi:hypothetical protein